MRPPWVEAMDKQKFKKMARRAIRRGEPLHVDVAETLVVELPWLEFGGDGHAAIVEAGRRAAAAELDVEPEQLVVEPE